MMVSGSGVRQVSRFLLCGFGGIRRAVFEAEAVVSSFENVAAVGKTIEQRGRHLRVAEHGGPLAEAEIGGDDDAGALVELAEQMEKQGSARGAEWQVAEFVEDDEVRVGKPPRDLAGFALKLLLFESVDEFDGGEEPDALAMMFDGLDADRRGEMRLARAGAADQDDVVGVFQELAAMELTRERLVDLAAGEVEASKIAIVREASGLELVGRRSDFSVGRLRLQELRQDRHGGFEGRGALFGQLADRLSHAVHFETAQHDNDGAAGRIMTHGAPPGLCAGRRSARRRPVVRSSASEPGAPLS